MVGRPRIWTPFERVRWMHEYEYTDDGRIRDSSRNVLTEHAPDYRVVVRIAGQRKAFAKAQLLALEWFDTPPRANCCVCGKGPHYRVVHLDGNPSNVDRDNIKYERDDVAARDHEAACLRRLMRSPAGTPWGVPGYWPGHHAPECHCTRCRA